MLGIVFIILGVCAAIFLVVLLFLFVSGADESRKGISFENEKDDEE